MEIIDGKKITVTFNSIGQNTKCSISCYDLELFSVIEKELYKNVPQLPKKYYFICNGEKVNNSLTLEQNKNYR